MTIEQKEQLVISWAAARQLFTQSTAEKQLLKTVEELGETAKAVLKNDLDGIKDGIGDVLVTLIIFAHMNGLSLNECLEAAWNEIKDRKGKTVNGTFVKEK